MNIFVGNLPYKVTEQELREEFAAFGKVVSVIILKDKYSKLSRGIAFFEMPSLQEGQAAIKGLNGKILYDRELDVSVALPRPNGRGNQTHGGRRSGGFGGGDIE